MSAIARKIPSPTAPSTADYPSEPLIAIVGSVDEGRTYSPPLASVTEARQASEELGRELAQRGCRIVVYSDDPGFMEAHVVRGYVMSDAARPRSIEVRAPSDARISFPEITEHREALYQRPDVSPDWEVSFYRSLGETDGIILLGGGLSTYVAGLIAVTYKIPLLAIATFGGNAKKAWEALSRDKGFATDEEIEAMAQDWHRTRSAATLVAGLLAARARLLAAEHERERQTRSSQRRTAISAIIAAGLFAIAVGTIPISWNWDAGTTGPLAALVVAPLLAGAAGSIVRVVFDDGREWTTTGVLGLAAGGVVVLLFVAAQIAATPDILDGDGARRLMFFVVPMAFVAGFTFDVVYEKLRATDVVRADAVQAPK